MAEATTTYEPRLKTLYKSELAAALKKDLNLKNAHQVPELEKVVLNIGLGRSKEDKQMFELASNTLRKITGQEPIETFAHKSIAGFKLREGQRIGLKVTLRGAVMYEFMDRLINVVLPRVRDFHGVPLKSFDSKGNYTMGLKEQSVFPELDFKDTTHLHGLEITICTSAIDNEGAEALLRGFGMPFEKNKKEEA